MNKLYSYIIYVIILIQFYGNTISNLVNIDGITLIDDFLMILIFVSLFFFKNNNKLIIRKYIFFFIFICAISALMNNVSVDVFILQLRSYLLPCVIYFIVHRLKLSAPQIISFFKNIVILSIPVLISALYEFFTGKLLFITENRFGNYLNFDPETFRVHSTIGNPIDYSNFVIIIICILLPSFFYNYYPIFKKKLTFILSIIFFVSLFMSNSRGPIIALIFGVIVFFLNSKKLSFNSIFKLFFIFGPFIIYFGKNVFDRISNLSLNIEDGYRFLWLSKSFEIVKDNPFFGVGPGKFGGWVSINYNYSNIYDLYRFDTDGISSIDMFFPHLIGETGIIGVISYLLIFSVFFKFLNKAMNTSNTKLNIYLLSVGLLLIPMLMIIGLTSISLETQLVLVLTFLIIGLLEKFIKINNEYNTGISN